MALVTIPHIPIPSVQNGIDLDQTYTTITVNAAGDKVGFVFRAPKSGDIRKIHFRVGIVTSPGETFDVRLETVDVATGLPTGTLFGANTNGSILVNTSNAWLITTLTADATVAKNDLLAISLVSPGTNAIQVNGGIGNPTVGTQNFPYPVDGGTGTYVKTDAPASVFAVEYSDGSFAYIDGTQPIADRPTLTFNSGSTPDEQGLFFTAPIGMRAIGFFARIDVDNDADVVLYDSASAVLASRTLDKDVRSSTGLGSWRELFASPITLVKDQVYRLALKPLSVGNVALHVFDYNSAGLLDQAMGTQAFHFTSRTDAGAWAQTATRLPLMGLIVDQVDAAEPGDAAFTGGQLNRGLN